MIQITKSTHIADKIQSLKLAMLQAENIQVTKSGSSFDTELKNLEKELSEKFSKRPPSDDPVISATRRLYRQIGWEPTKYRPSSEALVRRLIQGKGLYRINNLVDYGNLVSARYHIPMGLYDCAKIEGSVLIDVGRDDEYYQGISKDRITATGKIILRDDRGVFGNPTADSKRTSIQKETTDIIALFFVSTAINKDYLLETLHSLKRFYGLFTDKDITTDIANL